MKTKNLVSWMPVLLIVLHLLCALVSWIGNIYGWGVYNLFSAGGMRWTVTNFIPNLSAAPFGTVFMGLVTLSVLFESGLPHTFGSKVTMKQKRALSLALLVLAIIAVILATLLFLPSAILLNPFGTFHDSPFVNGLYGIACTAAIVVSNVYGLASGRFSNLSDTLSAHTMLLAHCLPCVLSMMLTAELMGAVAYANLADPFGTTYALIAWVLYLLPFMVSLVQYVKTR